MICPTAMQGWALRMRMRKTKRAENAKAQKHDSKPFQHLLGCTNVCDQNEPHNIWLCVLCAMRITLSTSACVY